MTMFLFLSFLVLEEMPLMYFDKLYDKLSDAEKKEFMGTFVESIELYPERLENGKFLKHIHFRFPVYYNGTVIDDISWENESTVETVVLLSKGNISSQNVRVEFSLEDMDMSRFQQGSTYEKIQEWVQEKYGLHVTHLNIAQVKRKHGIIERDNYNKPKSPDSKQPGCPEEKIKAIEAALRFYRMI